MNGTLLFTRIHFIEFFNIKLWHLSIYPNTQSSYFIFHDRIAFWKETSQQSIVMHDRLSVIWRKIIRRRRIELLSFLENFRFRNYKLKGFSLYLWYRSSVFTFKKTLLSKLIQKVITNGGCHIHINILVSVRSLMFMQ